MMNNQARKIKLAAVLALAILLCSAVAQDDNSSDNSSFFSRFIKSFGGKVSGNFNSVTTYRVTAPKLFDGTKEGTTVISKNLST